MLFINKWCILIFTIPRRARLVRIVLARVRGLFINSITPTQTVPLALHAGTNDIGQDIIQQVHARLGRANASIDYHAAFNIQFCSMNEVTTEGLAARGHAVVSTFTRFTNAALQPFAIRRTQTYIEGSLRGEDARDYMIGDAVDGRKVASHVSTNVNVPANIASELAFMFNSALNISDTSAFYGLGYILAQQRADMAAAGIQPNFNVSAQNALLYRDLVVAAAGVGALVDSMAEDVASGYLVFFLPFLSNDDEIVLNMIASGLPRMSSPLNNANHIAATMTSEVMPMRIYGLGVHTIPAIAHVSAATILATLYKVAALRGENTMLARGFLRAQTVLNGSTVVNGDATRWMTCMMEAAEVSWPRVVDYNWIWRALRIVTPMHDAKYFEAEAALLRSLPVDVLTRVGAGVGAALSLGASSVLHFFNITGRELNGKGNMINDQAAARALMGSLFNAQGVEESALFFNCAAGGVTAFTGMVVNPTSIRCVRWCNGANVVAAGAVDTWWQARFGLSIPYALRPESFTWMLDFWLECWGISGPGASWDLSADLVTNSTAALNGWFSDDGESKYREYAGSTQPYRHVSYGKMVLNAILQSTNLQNVAIVYQTYVKTSSKSPNRGAVENGFQLQFDAVLRTALPGSMPTYDWATSRVLAPSCSAQAIGALRFGMLRSGSRQSEVRNAGIALPQAVHTANMALGFGDLMSLVNTMGPKGSTTKARTGEDKPDEPAAGN